MLPIRRMQEIVDYQIGQNPPFAPPDQLIAQAEAEVAQLEQRFNRIETVVMTKLNQRMNEVYATLGKFLQDIAAQDLNGAARPQLKNIHQTVQKIKKIYEAVSIALDVTSQQLAARTEQNRKLNNEIQHLRALVNQRLEAREMEFLNECVRRTANYVAYS